MKNTNKKEKKEQKRNGVKFSFDIARYAEYLSWAFFAVVWALLVFYDGDTLYRASEQSLFLFNSHFFNESMTLPAGFLSYIGAFFVQFLHYPLLGATIYVLLLFVQYLLTKKVFEIPARWSLLALLPVAAVLAVSTQMGYWIFYIKIQGFYFMPLLGTIASLLVAWVCLKLKGLYAPVIVLWIIAGYMLFGVYAFGGAAVIAVASVVDRIKCNYGRRYVITASGMLLAVLVLMCALPLFLYREGFYSTMALDQMYLAGTPVHQWVLGNTTIYPNGIFDYWVPIILILLSYMLLALLRGSLSNGGEGEKASRFTIVQAVLLMCVSLFTFSYWYNDKNFHIENSQNRAMWNEDWEAVAACAKRATVPTRQIVLNKNMALLKLGRAGEDAFKYPEGSAEIDHPGVVHLTQTGGMMNYFQYGKFNFCYRWCIENAVEYGWRLEYLKHAVRCTLLSGQHKLAMRYINILKHTLFYRSWAEQMEALVENPSLISKQKEFTMPLLMYNYDDALELDDSYVEVYLSKSLSYTYSPSDSRLQSEAAVIFALTRKDVKLFWDAMTRYVNKGKLTRVPHHFQEAIILFTNLSKDVTTNIPIDPLIQKRFDAFIKKTQDYKGMNEKEMAPYFVEEFGDTYWYFYFFVREIKTN